MKVLLTTTLFAIGCGPAYVVQEVGGAEDCPLACQNLIKLGCEEGKPLEDGTTCEVFCQQSLASGHNLKPKCISSILSCGDIENCQ